uniref:Ribosomal protein L14 n=1 Tax=Pharyngomonas kirbyi TaxID=63601 RepID=A0A1W6R255_9EUKA|nr:ribosomal protein L14 [Pharyngomonas kirbyi]ARO47982.1 ribosomal protein L14 [Pharyngomonas kirbyi]
MINVQTKLDIVDNSGGILAQCIRILRKRHLANVGDLLIISIKNARPNKKVKKGVLYRSVLVRQNRNIQRKNGIYIKFKRNSTVLLNQKNNPIGNRIRGPVCQELRKKKLMKVISLAPTVF